VVYYNALILSEALAELESRGALASAEVLKHVSPVAWQHINFRPPDLAPWRYGNPRAAKPA